MYPNNGSCCWTCMPSPSWKPCWTAFITRCRTELLLRAEELGVPAYCGFEMLVAQAVYAAEHLPAKSCRKL